MIARPNIYDTLRSVCLNCHKAIFRFQDIWLHGGSSSNSCNED